jgi:large subunit ribosomal protein L11
VPKSILALIKLQVPGGKVTPAPPVGPALGQYGVPPGEAVRQLNDKTAKFDGKIVGVLITVYADKTFSILVKKPPASALLKDAAEVAKGSAVPNKEKVGKKITKDQLRKLAEEKLSDMNASSVDAAMRTLAGSARSMGIEIEG